MHQIRFRLGLRHRPRWGSLQRSPRPAGLRGPTSKEREGKGGDEEGKGEDREEGRGEKGRRGEKGGEGLPCVSLKFP